MDQTSLGCWTRLVTSDGGKDNIPEQRGHQSGAPFLAMFAVIWVLMEEKKEKSFVDVVLVAGCISRHVQRLVRGFTKGKFPGQFGKKVAPAAGLRGCCWVRVAASPAC